MTREEAIANLAMIYVAFIGFATNEQRKLIKDTFETATKALEEQEPKWILTSDKLPNVGQWVLVTKEYYQKQVEIMCYQGVCVGRHDVGNGWEEYEYPSWTSGHGDIQGSHPIAWMPFLPSPFEPQEREV